jgi:hypothetical protein
MKTIKIIFVGLLSLFVISCGKKMVTREDGKLTLSGARINLSKLGERSLNDMNAKIYGAVIQGKIKAYRFDSITATCLYKTEELKQISTLEQAVQFAPDPTNPDYLIDSIIKTEFKLQDIVGYSVAVKWTSDYSKGTSNLELYSFAINWKPVFGGIEIPEGPLFWVSYKDVEGLIKASDREEMNRIIFDSLGVKMGDF